MSDSNGRESCPNQPYRSVWMSHWMQTNRNTTPEKSNCPLEASENEENGGDGNMTLEPEISMSGEVLETNTSEMKNDSLIMGRQIHGKHGISSFLGDHMLAAKPLAGIHLEHGKAISLKCFGKSSSPYLSDIPSTSDNQFAPFNEELFQTMQKHSGLSLSSDQYIISEKFTNCLHNVETMKICATVGERMQRGFPGFSQTSHSFLITKTTDVNLPNECDIINTSSVITRINGKIPDNAFPFYNRGKSGVVLLPLSSSTDSEGKTSSVDVITSKAALNDKSSAETNTMDGDFFEKNTQSSAKVAPSEKVDVSSREAESQRPHISLPDINLELPAVPATARSSDSSGANSSKTQSLEMDVLVAHAELSPKLKLIVCSDDSGKDLNDRWVKRLKLSTSQSYSHVPKSSYPAEIMSTRKMKHFMNKILSSAVTSSEQASEKNVSKSVVSNKVDLFEDKIEKNKKSLLSLSWIQRWLQDGSRMSQKNRGAMMVCEPQNQKSGVGNLESQQFPSIGAMALVGKAMRGFKPCELQKRGSFTVWNTKPL